MQPLRGPRRVRGVETTVAAQADFESWLVAREPALQRLAALLAGDPHSAQDLVQTTLAKLYLAWDRLDHSESADAYARRIVLRYYEDPTEPETAEVLGISVGTVKSQASRAIAGLRARLPEEG
jgi:DNA-directed RNA polymerase specialized sigma24 family protein